MDTSTFEELSKEKAFLRKRASTVHARHIAEQNIYYKNSERFTLIILGIVGVEFLLTAILFDYMIVLNFVLTRILLWLLIILALSAFTRFMHILVFLVTHRAHEMRDKENRLRRRVKAIEKYENGIIDDSGIRMLYQKENAPNTTRTMRVVEMADWLLYGGVMLSGMLFGLIFL